MTGIPLLPWCGLPRSLDLAPKGAPLHQTSVVTCQLLSCKIDWFCRSPIMIYHVWTPNKNLGRVFISDVGFDSRWTDDDIRWKIGDSKWGHPAIYRCTVSCFILETRNLSPIWILFLAATWLQDFRSSPGSLSSQITWPPKMTSADLEGKCCITCIWKIACKHCR